ncbi:MAG: DinB family protein [Gemmataceae bacterium]|nr:DinB family protein [Gemmataceae bacterium]
MNGREAIQSALTSTRDLLGWYVSDLSDADLLVRPAPSANHIAWQLGHLVTAESGLIKPELPDIPYPELPAGFLERHANKNASIESTEGFGTRAEYLDLFTKARNATIAAVGKLSDSDLDRPTKGPMAKFAPTLGQLFLLVANHTLMHAGQFTVLRRKLGKPVLF